MYFFKHLEDQQYLVGKNQAQTHEDDHAHSPFSLRRGRNQEAFQPVQHDLVERIPLPIRTDVYIHTKCYSTAKQITLLIKSTNSPTLNRIGHPFRKWFWRRFLHIINSYRNLQQYTLFQRNDSTSYKSGNKNKRTFQTPYSWKDSGREIG